jgi:ABC-type dipeptide/oligopeptide/nickel transport system permease subunit
VIFDDRARNRFRKNRGALVGAVLVVVLVVFAALGPIVVHHDPLVSDFVTGVDHTTGLPRPPSALHWLGTDRVYRDQLARLATGGRLSLVIAFAATVISSAIGALVGVLSGWYEGSAGVRVPWPLIAGLVLAFFLVVRTADGVLALEALAQAAWLAAVGVLGRFAWLRAGPSLDLDTALMRVVDVGLSFPFLLLVMAIGAALDRTTVTSILAVLGLTGWLGTARLLRAKTMQLRNLEFITASRALGQSTAKVMLRHVLPNLAGPLIVVSTVSVAQMILAESVMSYLGVGLAPPVPTWGYMLFDGQDYYAVAPWLAIAPSVAILVAVLGFNLVGEGLRDALDPQQD